MSEPVDEAVRQELIQRSLPARASGRRRGAPVRAGHVFEC